MNNSELLDKLEAELIELEKAWGWCDGGDTKVSDKAVELLQLIRRNRN